MGQLKFKKLHVYRSILAYVPIIIVDFDNRSLLLSRSRYLKD